MSVPAVLRATHWTFAALFAAFVVSGIAIVIAHPRFYWGESGFFDVPAAFELPVATLKGHTSWGRNLHFLAVWISVVNAAIYVAWGVRSGHFRWPRYNTLQKAAYLAVLVIVFPALFVTGLTMSPAVTAAAPWLFTLFGGRQSARTLHFIAAVILVLFAAGHVMMVLRAGVRQTLWPMVTGREG
jgi:thiosulfate reductase cytochrome b subunit